MTPALVAAAIAAPLLRPEPWSAVALQQASSPDGALTGATAATGGRHTARASNGSRWPTGRPHARTLWACGRDGPGLSSLRAEDGRVPPRSGIMVRTLLTRSDGQRAVHPSAFPRRDPISSSHAKQPKQHAPGLPEREGPELCWTRYASTVRARLRSDAHAARVFGRPP